jgi:hypothetical protein
MSFTGEHGLRRVLGNRYRGAAKDLRAFCAVRGCPPLPKSAPAGHTLPCSKHPKTLAGERAGEQAGLSCKYSETRPARLIRPEFKG